MTPAAIEPFQHALERWHDFYLLAGTAAATLMGLLFVSLSIHLEKIVAEGGASAGPARPAPGGARRVF